MSTHKKPWYIKLREHAIDPMFRSSAPGSIGRLFSTTSFLICCKYWLTTSPNLIDREAPASLLQVFYWTTGYVFANTVVRTASGHIKDKMTAIVPDIPSVGTIAAHIPTATSTPAAAPAPVQKQAPAPAPAPKTAAADSVVDSDIG